MEEKKRKKGNHVISERRKLVFGYLSERPEERLELKKFLRKHTMTRPLYERFAGEYKIEVKNQTKGEKGQHLRNLTAVVEDAWDRLEGKEPAKRLKDNSKIEEVTEDEKTALARKVYDDAIHSSSAKDKELAIKMLGMLVEKKEVVLKIDGSLIARAVLRAEQRLREQGYGMVDVPEESDILREELRLHTGQGEGTDGQV